MNTTRDWMSDSDLGLPSGCEVESATFHVPVREALVVTSPAPRSGLRAKVDNLKSAGLSKLHDMQRSMGDRTYVMKSTMQRSMTNATTSMRTGVHGQVTKMQSSMQSSPAKWAGIAAGTGFALGLAGRVMHWRSKHRERSPLLVIVESTC